MHSTEIPTLFSAAVSKNIPPKHRFERKETLKKAYLFSEFYLKVPATINRYLRDYQRDGVRFLYQHYSENTGAILGDDMGLGKTVQVTRFQ